MALVLSRHENESIVFPDLGITITVVRINGDKARLAIEAPKEVVIHRKEVNDAIEHEKAKREQELKNLLDGKS